MKTEGNFNEIARRLFPNETTSHCDAIGRASYMLVECFEGDAENAMHGLIQSASLGPSIKSRLDSARMVAVIAWFIGTEDTKNVMGFLKDAESEEDDLKIKRCLTCSGHFDTPGDYCPSCASAADEDNGILDPDLFPID
jgi:hypothetical protein